MVDQYNENILLDQTLVLRAFHITHVTTTISQSFSLIRKVSASDRKSAKDVVLKDSGPHYL